MDPLGLVLGPKAPKLLSATLEKLIEWICPHKQKVLDWLIFVTQATNKRCSKFGFGPLLLEVYS